MLGVLEPGAAGFAFAGAGVNAGMTVSAAITDAAKSNLAATFCLAAACCFAAAAAAAPAAASAAAATVVACKGVVQGQRAGRYWLKEKSSTGTSKESENRRTLAHVLQQCTPHQNSQYVLYKQLKWSDGVPSASTCTRTRFHSLIGRTVQ